MDFEFVTLFPELISSFVSAGLVGKAVDQGLVHVHVTNPREFALDRHRTADDQPYGGGAGMVIKPEPVAEAIEQVERTRGVCHKILLSPSGRVFDQATAARLAAHDRVMFLCGRYEGIDDRIREQMVDEVLSLGDFVLNGGEIAALAMLEAIARLREGFMGNSESIAAESFRRDAWGPLLEYPQYTRPALWRGHRVPPVLLAGDHEAAQAWRLCRSVVRTWQIRPELRSKPTMRRDRRPLLAVEFGAEASESWEVCKTWASKHGCDLVGIAGTRAAIPHDLPTAEKHQVFRDLRDLRRWLRKGQDVAHGVDESVGVFSLHVAPEVSPVGGEISEDLFGAIVTCAEAGPYQVTAAFDLVRVGATNTAAEMRTDAAIRPVFVLPCATGPSRSPQLAPTSQRPDAALLVPAEFVQNHLAIGSQMTESPQPKSPIGDRFALALWALERLDREDLKA